MSRSYRNQQRIDQIGSETVFKSISLIQVYEVVEITTLLGKVEKGLWVGNPENRLGILTMPANNQWEISQKVPKVINHRGLFPRMPK